MRCSWAYTDKAKGIPDWAVFYEADSNIVEQEQEANQKHLDDLLLMDAPLWRTGKWSPHLHQRNPALRSHWKTDEAVLNRLISKILVGEVKKIDGQKVQEVRIVYNFVGEILNSLNRSVYITFQQ